MNEYLKDNLILGDWFENFFGSITLLHVVSDVNFAMLIEFNSANQSSSFGELNRYREKNEFYNRFFCSNLTFAQFLYGSALI